MDQSYFRRVIFKVGRRLKEEEIERSWGRGFWVQFSKERALEGDYGIGLRECWMILGRVFHDDDLLTNFGEHLFLYII